jgi:hypothetical protein
MLRFANVMVNDLYMEKKLIEENLVLIALVSFYIMWSKKIAK